MHGNVMEWCRDSHLDEPEGGEDPFYEGDPDEDRVVRGGSWLHAARLSRSGARMYNDPEARYNDLGLRVAIVRAK